MNNDPMFEILQQDFCPRESIGGERDSLTKFFEGADLRISLGELGGRRSLSKAARAEILAVDRDDQEYAELIASRSLSLGKGCTPPAELEALAKGNPKLRKAAGCIAHACRKSLSVTEALEMTTNLFSDQCDSEELSLLQRAQKALDISAYLQVLAQVFAKPI